MNLSPIGVIVFVAAALTSFAAEPTTVPVEIPLNAEAPRELLVLGTPLVRLATGFKFLEGPVWFNDDHGGYLIFCDGPGDRLYKWTAKDSVTVFREHAGQPNGDTSDLQGRLITCENTGRRVTRTEADGTITPIALTFEGNRLNSTNDVVVKSDGTIWFTDPTYGLPKGQSREIKTQNVYCLDPTIGKITAVATDFDQPNGLCFSPDEKFLYIGDSGRPRHVRRFDVLRVEAGTLGQVTWTLHGGGIFCKIGPGVPDGMRCDADGRLWTTAGDGAHVYLPDGTPAGVLAVPETPANLAFGGKDGTTLFICAKTSLYSIETKVKDATTVARSSKP